jgi:hypothetical protein
MSASLHSQSTEPCAKNTAVERSISHIGWQRGRWAETTPGQILNWGARRPVDAIQARRSHPLVDAPRPRCCTHRPQPCNHDDPGRARWLARSSSKAVRWPAARRARAIGVARHGHSASPRGDGSASQRRHHGRRAGRRDHRCPRAIPFDTQLDDAALERVSRDAEDLGGTDDVAGEGQGLDAKAPLRGFEIKGFDYDLRHDLQYRGRLLLRRSSSPRAPGLPRHTTTDRQAAAWTT